MDKEELLKEISKTKEHLAAMKKMLKEYEYERWKPQYMQEYYSVNAIGEATESTWRDSDFDEYRYDFYNCFQTREQAEQEAEKILVRRTLEAIARRLNKDEKIDWSDNAQVKYSIYLDATDNEIDWDKENRFITQGAVYCLDMDFYKIAILEIGEERLQKYLRGE